MHQLLQLGWNDPEFLKLGCFTETFLWVVCAAIVSWLTLHRQHECGIQQTYFLPTCYFNHYETHSLHLLTRVTPSLASRTLGNGWMFSVLNLTPYSHVYLPHITGFHIKVNHQTTKESQTTHSHTSRCHHCHWACTVSFVLFHNITCYTTSLFITVHCVNTPELLWYHGFSH